MLTTQALKDLQAELHSIRCMVRLVLHVNGIDVIGARYADRLIACSELRKKGVPDDKIFHYDPPIPKLCRR